MKIQKESDEKINSSKQILKSTSIVGGSQLIQILLGIIRVKFVAVILGASGVGLLGLYQSIIDMVRNSTSFGINFSGVKDIAEANQSKDFKSISKSILILRRWALGTGLLGLIVSIVFCVPISKYTFNNSGYAINIALLSASILFLSISQGQSALLQGMQHITSMAKAGVIGAFTGSIISIPLYYLLGNDGIVPSLLLISICTLIITWLFTRNIKVEKLPLSLKDSFNGGLKMAKFGAFIVANSLVTTLIMYFLKSYIAKKTGFTGVGLYQAVWTITNTYLGILLNSMLADYFPRLSANSGNNNEINRLANEQYEITLLLGGPLMIFLLSFSPMVISVLYSSTFLDAVPLLQWHVIGSFMVLISWPAGVIFLGAGKGEYSFACEMITLFFYVICIVIGWNSYGILSLGVAYCVKALLSITVILILAKKLTGFKMTIGIKKIVGLFSILVTLCVINIVYNEGVLEYVFGSIIFLAALGYTYNRLRKIIDLKKIFLRFVGNK